MSGFTQYLEVGKDKNGQWDYGVTVGLFDGLSVEDARKFRDMALLAIVEAHNAWWRMHMSKQPLARTIDDGEK